jgi:hypothetical protein
MAIQAIAGINYIKMKKTTLILIFFVVLIGACKKKDEFNNYLRIRNSLTTISFSCKVESADFGTVAPGTTTDYKVVPQGVCTMTGDLNGTLTLPDSITVDHKFTLGVNADSTITLTEDR